MAVFKQSPRPMLNPMRSLRRALTVALLVCLPCATQGFVGRRSHRHAGAHHPRALVGATPPHTPTTQLHATEKLVFRGDFNCISGPLPEGTTQEDVARFLRQPETRHLFLSGGGKVPIQEPAMTQSFETFWNEACDYFDSPHRPEEGDYLISRDSVVKFPGLTLTTTSLSGVKLLLDQQGLPAYKCFLLAEKQQASGPKPIVWLFNKLTGNSDLETGVFHPPRAKARSTVSMVQDDEMKNWAFSFQCELQVTVEFPAVLVKILPTTKAKMEEQGSASVLKAVKGDVKDSIDALQQEFCEQHAVSIT